MHVQLSQYNILPAHVSTFASYLPVECTATLTGNNGVSENYNITFVRNPITGRCNSVICTPKQEHETTENTLTCEAVQDYCEDHLNDM